MTRRRRSSPGTRWRPPAPPQPVVAGPSRWTTPPRRRRRELLLGVVVVRGEPAAAGGEGALGTGRRRQGQRRARNPLADDTVDGLGGVRVRQHRERDEIAVDLQRMQVDVVVVVARLVVALVEGLARRAAPDGLLLLRLRHLRAGEEAAGGDAGQDEGLVVAPPGELPVVVRLTDQGVVRLEQVLDRLRARRDRDAVRRREQI